MNVRELRRELTALFRARGFESPAVEAALIASEALGVRGAELPLHDADIPAAAQLARIREFQARRLNHEPWQYIFGHAPFRSLDLRVGPGVLIPRPETEFMIDFILDKLPRGALVCELGVGSGAISLALGSERPDLTLRGCELSPEALHWAELNREKLGLGNVHFYLGDLFAPFPAALKFDAVAANLPYVAAAERAVLPPDVRDYEPAAALFAPDDGFGLIERAIREAPAHLKREQGQLFFELGEGQGDRARACALSGGFFTGAEIRCDQYGVPRFLFAVRS